MTDGIRDWPAVELKDRKARHAKDMWRARSAELSAKYRRDNPIKARTRDITSRAIQSGKLIRPDHCTKCDKQCTPDAHHPDYAKPLYIMWLCRRCHADWHLENEAINGDEPVGMLDRFERFSDKTFADAAERYLKEFDGKSKRRQEYALEPVMQYVGKLRLIDVDDEAMQEYKHNRTQEVMAGTVNKEIATVTAVLNKAADVWRWIPSAPKIQRVKGLTRKPYPITWKEQESLFGKMGSYLRKICIFAVNTGVRRAEIFKLKWSDRRNVGDADLFILRDTKNGKDRPVILNSLARRSVNSMQGKSESSVFPPVSIPKPFNKAWVKAGLPDDPLIRKGIHNLRHTFGYRLRSEGVPPEDRDALLGHHNHSLTQHYALPDIQRLSKHVEKITKPRDTAVLR